MCDCLRNTEEFLLEKISNNTLQVIKNFSSVSSVKIDNVGISFIEISGAMTAKKNLFLPITVSYTTNKGKEKKLKTSITCSYCPICGEKLD